MAKKLHFLLVILIAVFMLSACSSAPASEEQDSTPSKDAAIEEQDSNPGTDTSVPEASIHSDEIAGVWDMYTEGLVYRISFEENNGVEFIIGYIDSEIALKYAGKYTIEGNVCVIDMTDQIEASEMYPDYKKGDPILSKQKIEVGNGEITLEYVSGDKLFEEQEVGVVHMFELNPDW